MSKQRILHAFGSTALTLALAATSSVAFAQTGTTTDTSATATTTTGGTGTTGTGGTVDTTSAVGFPNTGAGGNATANMTAIALALLAIGGGAALIASRRNA